MPRLQLIWQGVLVRDQPPVVGDYCNPPSTGFTHLPCCYKAATCGGPNSTCPRCEFSFCENHYPTHLRKFVAPVDFWQRGMKRLKRGLNYIAENRKRPMPCMGPLDGEL